MMDKELEKDFNRIHKTLMFYGETGRCVLLEKIAKALTPPTEEQVLKALSKYFKKGIAFIGCHYEPKNKTFIIRNYVESRAIVTLNDFGGVWINPSFDLPPHVIIIISRFYEDNPNG